MINGVGPTRTKKCALHFGTHNGIFHRDDVFATSILEMAYMKTTAYVVRTRDLDELSALDIVVDIGGGKFDHHMPGFNECRPTGEKYASAGLVWRAFAEKAIKNVMLEVGTSIRDDEIQVIKEQIDREIIIPIDLEDNGEKVGQHTFSFITQFVPTWLEAPDYDSAFMQVEAIVFSMLKAIIKNMIVNFATKPELETRIQNNLSSDGILELPAQTIQWLDGVTSYNKENNNFIKFVFFPYPAGGWAAQSVPPSIEEEFEQLVPFPKEWAGLNEKTLPQISGIPDASFCHNGCFFVRAQTKQSVIEMCRIAMN